MTTLSMESTVVAVRQQVSADLGEEAVILGVEKGLYYSVDEVGARIWSFLREPSRVSAIRDVVLADFAVDRETCERDVLAFLQRLEAESLISVSDGP